MAIVGANWFKPVAAAIALNCPNGDWSILFSPPFVTIDPDGDFNNCDKLRTNKIGPDVLGAIADWLAAKLGAMAR